jgi:hypothetical protein
MRVLGRRAPVTVLTRRTVRPARPEPEVRTHQRRGAPPEPERLTRRARIEPVAPVSVQP